MAAVSLENYRALYFTNGGSKEMDVDGSGTPVEFTLESLPVDQRLFLREVSLYIEDGTNMESDEFGGLPALTNGVQLFIETTPTPTELANLQDNADVLSFFPIWQQIPVLKDNDQQHYMARIIYPNPILIDSQIKVVVRDNLTGLDMFRISVSIDLIPEGN